ncbi:VOC family protein [Sphingomonas abietis]|uniref:VOC domain-containing protein n=1 Tax=Sphingomonas abietis TaxID=3012344 RepID=A0ABY7NJR0_9SPHN|nr:hypothetical protein [Sphingomonas abietis]WBO21482.1 hypothetical protein PBT88_15010 [Sphingomonas abietis]
MIHQGIDPVIVEAWLSARSVARGLPLPVPEYGGRRFHFRDPSGNELAVMQAD